MNTKHNKVYVDNLAAVTTERELEDLFSPFGNVAKVNIAVDRVHHKSRGFGFVTMATSAGARAAIQALNGKAVGTCTLTVSEAWPHEQRTGSSGGPEVPAAPGDLVDFKDTPTGACDRSNAPNERNYMRRPKGTRTRKSVAKRFKITGTGKVLFRGAGRRHLLQGKNSKRRRSLRKAALAGAADIYRIRQNLPFSH